jgi:phosphoglycerate kinase
MKKVYLPFIRPGDVNLRDKLVLIRVGIDSPVEPKTGKIIDNPRIQRQAAFLKWLAGRGAKVVAVGHQGRPGRPDFTTTEQHAVLLSKHMKRPVKYIPSDFGRDVEIATHYMKRGDVILLENVRMHPDEMKELDPETHHDGTLVKGLEHIFSYYINNDFSTSHRPYASMVGFTGIPNIIGRDLENELRGALAAKALDKHPYVYVMGGVKIPDLMPMIESSMEEGRIDRILCGGMLGSICLLAKGYRLGREEEVMKLTIKGGPEQFVSRMIDLIRKYPDRIVSPVDVVVDAAGRPKVIPAGQLPSKYPIADIGPETVKIFSKIIHEAKVVYLKGAMGQYEEQDFEKGSMAIMKAAAHSGAYTLVGGGSVSDLAEKPEVRGKFSHVSLAGGALVEVLCNKRLPALRALEASAQKWKGWKGKTNKTA